jgi:electron transfer flavoprotein beta subunit
MSLNIAVCVKAVPNSEQYDKIQLDPVKKTIVREGIESVINAADLHAIELALRIKEKCGARITLVSMGPGSASAQLREGLSYGCDDAYLISDRKFAGADSLATSYTLAKGLNKIGNFDLILLGNVSEDGATAHVPSQLGEMLNLPHITDVVAFEVESEKRVFVKKEVDKGVNEYRVNLPAVFGVAKKLNKVRHPSIQGIFGAKSKPLTVLTAADFDDLDDNCIGLSGSPTQPGEYRDVAYRRECVEISGSDAEKAVAVLKTISALINLH